MTCLLTSVDRHAYHKEGFFVLREVFERHDLESALAEAEHLRLHSGLVEANNLRCRFMPDVATGQQLFEVFDPIVDISPACAQLAEDERLLAVLAEVYGEQACLFKDKLIFKPAGAKGYGVHQDWIAWKGFPRSFITVLIALDSADLDNGCTQVYPGVHRRGCLSPEDGDYHELTREHLGSVEPVPLVLAPGDVALFGGFTPHFSGPNRSPRPRRQLYLSYNARSDGGDQRSAHYAEFQCKLRSWREKQGTGHVYFR